MFWTERDIHAATELSGKGREYGVGGHSVMGYSTLGIALGGHTLDERTARERGQKAKTDKPIFLLIILFLSSPSPADPRIRDPTKPYRAGKAKGGNCTDPHTEAGGIVDQISDIHHTCHR
jgi:hypothetical protein